MKIFKILLITVIFGFSAQAFAQSEPKDSLSLVKNYLLEIQATVNSVKSIPDKIEKLDSLIQVGVAYKALFYRLSENLLQEKETDRERMQRSFNFILQSVVLFKTDLKDNAIKESETELAYLNKHIPNLMKDIQHCFAGHLEKVNDY